MDPTNTGTMPNLTDPNLNLFGGGGGGSGGGINWGNLLGGLGGAYGAATSAGNSQGLINAGNAGFGMARGAYNPTLFGSNGVGGSGFSLTSPNGGPGSISTSLGAFNPMYGNYASGAGQYLNNSLGLANTASTGATGAYNSALSSILPQLQNMQGNLLQANNNALFQRGQLGSGSFGQYGSGGNPVNLTTQSLGSGFALQDLNAITAAQNQGLNFFNSNLQGAGALGNLGYGATNTGLGFIGAGNATGQLPLAYSGLYGGQQIGATNANANTIGAIAGRNGINLGGGYGGLASGIGGGLGGFLNGLFGGSGGGGSSGGSLVGLLNQGYNWLTGGGGGGMATGGMGLGGGGLFGGMPGVSGGIGGTDYLAGGLGTGSDLTSGLGQYVGGSAAGGGGFGGALGGAGAIGAGSLAPDLMAPAAPAAGDAATAGVDLSSLAQNGYASLNGVPGAAVDTSAGGGGGAAAADGVNPALATLGYGALFGAGAYGLDRMFENNSQVNSSNMYNTNMNNAAGLTALAQQPGNPFASSDLTAANSWEALAQAYASGAIDPNANPNNGIIPSNYAYGMGPGSQLGLPQV